MSSSERVRNTISDKQAKATVLKQHYYTPAEGQIPPLNKRDVVHQAAQVRRDSQSKNNQEIEQEGKDNIVIDGFYLLEATGMGFPEDARQALIADKKLVGLVEDDMSYFSELLYIDASENRLQLAPFGAFPKLRELRLACNQISFIEPELFGFECLTCLDLSYNRLTVDCIQALDVLPNLRDLDISGNKLKELPDDWQHFRMLEKLLLDYNLFENNDIFTSISSAPNLRHLSVYDNHLSVFPELALSFEGFRVLETLDLACNYFNEEADLEPATRLPRISTLKLYGNRIFGESGEDPLYIYIEGLVDDAIAYREANAPHLPNIDFVTEFPKVKTIKKGQPLGRQANYRDFAIVQVETNAVQTNRSWRERGNQTIFAETMHQKRRLKGSADFGLNSQPSTASLPDMTFLTGVATSGGGLGPTPPHTANTASHSHNGAHGEVADDVMQRVAGDMGLISSAELLMLRDKAKVNSTMLSYLENDIALDLDDEEYEYELHGEPAESRHANLTSAQRRERVQRRLQAQEQQQQVFMQDQVPGGLFRQQMGADNTTLQPQPVALKTAMKALQMALNQPLTNYDELPSKSAMFPSKDYYKPTRSSVLRQMPRHALPDSLAEAEAEQYDAQAEMERYGVVPPAPARGKVSSAVGRMVAAGAAANSVAGSSSASVGGVSVALSFRTTQSQMSQSTTGSNQSGTPKPKSSALRTAGQQSVQRAPVEIPKIPWKARLEDPDLPTKRYSQRGLKDSGTVKAKRQEQRDHTLAQIDEVLQNLNSHTSGWSERQAIQGLNSATNRGHAAKSEKETMREMRDFAQPFTGVKSLLNMVTDIEQEFFS